MKFDLMSDGKEIYVYCDGLRVAKRGHPNTPQAKTWITLVPGYTVISSGDHTIIEVAIDPNVIGNQ
jgi:hypothetical protein